MKMEPEVSSETFVRVYRTTRFHTAEDNNHRILLVFTQFMKFIKDGVED
jgi:hypothetical protein